MASWSFLATARAIGSRAKTPSVATFFSRSSGVQKPMISTKTERAGSVAKHETAEKHLRPREEKLSRSRQRPAIARRRSPRFQQPALDLRVEGGSAGRWLLNPSPGENSRIAALAGASSRKERSEAPLPPRVQRSCASTLHDRASGRGIVGRVAGGSLVGREVALLSVLPRWVDGRQPLAPHRADLSRRDRRYRGAHSES